MRPTGYQMLLTVVSLCTASVLLTGCPKSPWTGATTSGVAGSSTSQATAVGAGGAGVDAPRPSGGGGGVGTAAAAGTTFPLLPSPQDFTEVADLRDIHFDFDQYRIRPQDADILSSDARWLKAHRIALVLVEGHADERGTSEYNLALGERRAKATREHLIALGIDGSRIATISYGKERPLCTAHTESCWSQNRRARFLVKE